MPRLLARLISVLASAMLLGLAAPEASAAPAVRRPVSMVLTSSVTSVNQGATIRLTGRVWQGQTGNRTPVYFSFQRRGTVAWVQAGYVWSTDRGDFAKTVRATSSGTWKATYRGTTTRAAAARGRIISVYGMAARQIAFATATSSHWQSAKLRIPTTDYRAVASYNCSSGGGLTLSWDPDGLGFEYASAETEPSGTAVLNGHAGAQTGYFEVWTSTCTWTLKVYAGTARVLV